MKIAVIGGAGVRTPLLVGGLTGSDLPIDEIALYDVDQDRLSTIGGVAARMAAQGRVVLSASLDECVTGADFVFTSIRVGGLAHRVRDEDDRAGARHRRSGDRRSGGVRDGGAHHPAHGAVRARDRPRRAARLDHQLHEPGRHGHARRCAPSPPR